MSQTSPTRRRAHEPSEPATSRVGADRADECLNCGRVLGGRFCAHCGQEARVDLRVRAAASRVAAGMLDLDSRLWGTLRLLFTRPGALSLAYRNGQRVRYLPPLRLYLLASVLFFAALELAPIAPIARITFTSPTEATTLANSDAYFGLWARMARAAENPEQLNLAFLRGLGWAFFLLIPVFALLLNVAWRGRRLLYAYHVVFALHVHAYSFLLLAVALVSLHLAVPVRAGAVPVLLAVAFGLVHVALAAGRYYDERPGKVIVRLAVVGGLYGIAFLLSSAALLGLVLLLF